MHIALFGGSFNPPHVAHLLGAAYLRAVAGVDAVWLVPAFRHRFGKPLAPFEDRVRLCEAMCRELPRVEVSRLEEELQSDGRTLVLVEHLLRTRPGDRFSLVIGADILPETPRWYEFDRLSSLVDLLVLGRSGHDPVRLPLARARYLYEVPMPRVSSTEIRERLARGDDVSELVPQAVLEEIRRRGLYGAR